MSLDSTDMIVLSAVGSTGLAIGGGLWTYVKALHTSKVQELHKQIEKLEVRSNDCEEDRKQLHNRLNDQSERITKISVSLGRLEGKMGT